MDYQLVVLKGRSAAKTVRLGDGITTVGRQDGCELTVRSSQVSRKHCQIFEKKGLLLVKDLGSANGTFVNGKRIEEQRVLEPGDILMVGPIEFRIESAASPSASTPAGGDVSSGTGERPKPSDTAVPELVQAESPIPLDEDDVLEFVIGDDDPAPAAKTAPPSKPTPAPKPPPSAKPSPKPEAAPAAKAPTSKPKPKAEPKEDAPADDEGANEAIAEFLMGIELDDDDRR